MGDVMTLLKTSLISLVLVIIVGSASAQPSGQVKVIEQSHIDYINHPTSNEGKQFAQPIPNVPEGNTLTLLASFSLAGIGLFLRRKRRR